MFADVLKGGGERGEFAPVEVSHEVFLDAAAVYGSRVVECFESRRCDEDVHDAPVLGWSFAANESGGFHAVDDACEAAFARQDSVGELGHAQPVACL